MDTDIRIQSLQTQCVEACRRVGQVASLAQSLLEEQRLLLGRLEDVEKHCLHGVSFGSQHCQDYHQLIGRLSQVESEQRAATLNLGVILSGTGDFQKQQNQRWRSLEEALERRFQPLEAWCQVGRLAETGRGTAIPDNMKEQLAINTAAIADLKAHMAKVPSVDHWLTMVERQSRQVEAMEELHSNLQEKSVGLACDADEIQLHLEPHSQRIEELKDRLELVDQWMHSSRRDIDRQVTDAIGKVDGVSMKIADHGDRLDNVDELRIRLELAHTRMGTQEERFERYIGRIENLPTRQEVRSIVREDLIRQLDEAKLAGLRSTVALHAKNFGEVCDRLDRDPSYVLQEDSYSHALAASVTHDIPAQNLLQTPPRNGIQSVSGSFSQEVATQSHLSTQLCSNLASFPVSLDIAEKNSTPTTLPGASIASSPSTLPTNSLTSSPSHTRSETLKDLEDSKSRLDDVDDSMADVQLQLAKLTNDASIAISKTWRASTTQ